MKARHTLLSDLRKQQDRDDTHISVNAVHQNTCYSWKSRMKKHFRVRKIQTDNVVSKNKRIKLNCVKIRTVMMVRAKMKNLNGYV